MTNQTEKEFKTLLPSLTDKLRTGFVTAIIATQFCAIVYLFIAVIQAKNERSELQAKLYQQMIEYIQPTKEKLEASTEKIDKVVEKANTSLDISDSLNTQSLKQIKR